MFKEATKAQRRILLAAALGWALDAFDVMLYAMVVAYVMRDLHISKSTIGFLNTLTLLASGIGGLLFGWIADRVGRTRALMLSIGTYSVCSFASGLSTSVQMLAAARFLLGLGMGGEWNTGATLVAETWPVASPRQGTRRRAKLVGLGLRRCRGRGWLRPPALSELALRLLHRHRSRAGHPLDPPRRPRIGFVERKSRKCGCLTLLRRRGWSAIPTQSPTVQSAPRAADRTLSASNTPSRHPEERSDVGTGFSSPTTTNYLRHALILLALNFFGLFAWWGLFTWIPPYLSLPVEQGGRGFSQLGATSFLVFLNLAGMFPGYISFGFVADRIGRRLAFFVYLFAAALCVPLYALARRPSAILLLGAVVAFFGTGFFTGSGIVGAELFPTRIRARALGFTYNGARMLSSIAPYVIGALSLHRGLSGAFFVCSIGFLLAAFTALLLPETRGRTLI